MAFFSTWDSETLGIMNAGSIKRASSSNNKTFGEVNHTGVDLAYGTFVAYNKDGGIKKISALTDTVHGFVVRDIYPDAAPHDRCTNIAHFSQGDAGAALAVKGSKFNRGDKVYIVATGDDAGKVTTVKDGNFDLGFIVETVSAANDCVQITLAY